MSKRKPYVGGNWKMNTNLATASRLTRAVVDGLTQVTGVDVAVFPPFPYLLAVGSILRERSSFIRLGAQDAYFEPEGAFTGEVSVPMLRDCGVQVVIVGHSERRHVVGETDEIINKKVRAVLEAGLECVLCVGETLAQRQTGQTDAVCERQVRLGLLETPVEHIPRLTIAYEPFWAIGTGKNASPADAQDAQFKIRRVLASLYSMDVAARVRVQYGGSLKPSNAAEIMAQPDVDGGLIGGASLKAEEFVPIVRAAAAAAANKA